MFEAEEGDDLNYPAGYRGRKSCFVSWQVMIKAGVGLDGIVKLLILVR
jgi:hypothetical protein